MKTPRPARPGSTSQGFSMAELMVVVALGTLIVFALQQAIVGQRRYYDAQRSATERHETVRVAMAVLGSALREANLANGDVAILAPGRVRVRMPLGLGFVCGRDATGLRVGVVALEGRWTAGAGDSVLVQRSGAWRAEALTTLGGPAPQVPCVASGGSVARFGQLVPDIVPGSAARPFRSLVFEVAAQGAGHWLFRADGALREVLAGPLDGAQGFQAWYEDGRGAVVASAAAAQRVGVRITTRSAGSRQDTVVMRFGGRNR